MKATLYIAATPIGNLEDITLRALRILKEVSYILCEDTRTTKKLLSRYEITTPTLSYHSHSSKSTHDHIIRLLKEGKDLALVSDAGTPCISDPGVLLLETIIREYSDEVTISPLPGASALSAALSVSGFSLSPFIFYGFLPQKKGRETLLKKISETAEAIVIYESPHRIMKLLEKLVSLGEGGRQVMLGRELTKQFEECIRGDIGEVLEGFRAEKYRTQGEFVVVLGPKAIEKRKKL